jgi:hypothetical protein
MPARHYQSSQDFLVFARLAEVLTYRHSSVLGLGTNDLEKVYAEAAKLLNESKGAEFEAACDVLRGAMPESVPFKLAFSRISMGRQYLARYTLQKIEEAISSDKEKKVQGGATVHIEHVMPQKLSTAWKEQLGSGSVEHPAHVNRWGNLTLLYGSDNIGASNDSFDVKKSFYRSSQVELTQALCGYPEWGPEQIRQRQEWLAEVADQTWSVGVAGDRHNAVSVVPRMSLDAFERRLSTELWSIVEPLCTETSAEEARGLHDRVSHYLSNLTDGQAARLAAGIADLASRSEVYDAEARRVLRGAVEYVLLHDDALPDTTDGGLSDDVLVFNAACDVLLRPSLKLGQGEANPREVAG